MACSGLIRPMIVAENARFSCQVPRMPKRRNLRRPAAPTACSIGAKESIPQLALKEWALACAAMADGKQTVLLRKGGLKDPVFKPQASEFFLFPTAFHNTEQLVTKEAAEAYADLMDFQLGETLEMGLIAELTGCWTTEDPEVLGLTRDFHIWSDGLLSTRMKWKPKQPLTLMELRCWKLGTPLRIPMEADYKGCFSWVDVAAAVASEASGLERTPVLDDVEFESRQAGLREQLKKIKADPALPVSEP